jgi:hypothetical protein
MAGHWAYRIVHVDAEKKDGKTIMLNPDDRMDVLSEVFFTGDWKPWGYCEATISSECHDVVKWVEIALDDIIHHDPINASDIFENSPDFDEPTEEEVEAWVKDKTEGWVENKTEEADQS